MHLTNVVCSGSLCCRIDLKKLCYELDNAIYDSKNFPGLIWKHRRISGSCLVFSNGVIHCNGKADSFMDGVRRLRRYARYLQKLRFSVQLKEVKVMTASAFHCLKAVLDIKALVKETDCIYEPELFPMAVLRRNGIVFNCFYTGKIIIAGIKSMNQIDDTVLPTLLELNLYTRKKD
ncbi:MAG: hypothetical protein N0E59_22775 [Candidatus Thiodiazotropha taylori]|nr:hypothetical protein [Candidatus Thiodiazotropha taylori]MCW4285945.1 hypothetical protein [Candidatus Thiodiazotropha taylori]